MKTVSVIELAATLETQQNRHRIHCIFFFSSSSPAAVFLLKCTFKAKAKHFKLGWLSIVATWRDANGFIVRPLKGSKEEESRRARGSWRLMTPVHRWFEVTKRREEEGWCSVLLEVEQTFHCWRSGLCCELLLLLLNQGSYSNRDKQTLLPGHPSRGVTLTQCTTADQDRVFCGNINRN